MAYSDFNLPRVRETFGLVIEEPKSLFPNILPTTASNYLITTLDENLALATAINTEKARSEMVIAPVLLEIRRQLNYELVTVTIFSVPLRIPMKCDRLS
jgi:hypothetical protein